MAQSGEEFAEQVQYAAQGRAKSRSLLPLRRMLPFLMPYRWHIAAASAALIVSSTATLVLPAAGRVMLDHGFNAADAAQVNSYFLPFLVAVSVLAIATAIRFYFVTR